MVSCVSLYFTCVYLLNHCARVCTSLVQQWYRYIVSISSTFLVHRYIHTCIGHTYWVRIQLGLVCINNMHVFFSPFFGKETTRHVDQAVKPFELSEVVLIIHIPMQGDIRISNHQQQPIYQVVRDDVCDMTGGGAFLGGGVHTYPTTAVVESHNKQQYQYKVLHQWYAVLCQRRVGIAREKRYNSCR